MIKPIPCRKFKNASTLAWIAKLTEETDEVARGEVQRRVNEKNKARGYHDEADS